MNPLQQVINQIADCLRGWPHLDNRQPQNHDLLKQSIAKDDEHRIGVVLTKKAIQGVLDHATQGELPSSENLPIELTRRDVTLLLSSVGAALNIIAAQVSEGSSQDTQLVTDLEALQEKLTNALDR